MLLTEKNYDLEDDKKMRQDSPKFTGWLIRDSAAIDIITVDHEIGCRDIGVSGNSMLGSIKAVDCFNIGDHDEDGAREDEEKGHNA